MLKCRGDRVATPRRGDYDTQETTPCLPTRRKAMYLQMAKRLLFETDKRLLWKLAWNMGFKGMLSVEKHKAPARSAARSSRRSCTSRSSTAATCAARAAGWTWPPSSRRSAPTAMHKLVREAKEMGNVFFGIVGGEPFMHPHLLDMLGRASRLLLPDLHQRPVHHRRAGQADAAARQRHAADQRRGHRDRQRRAPRPGRRAVSKTMQGCRTASSTRSSPASAPACARRTSTTC